MWSVFRVCKRVLDSLYETYIQEFSDTPEIVFESDNTEFCDEPCRSGSGTSSLSHASIDESQDAAKVSPIEAQASYTSTGASKSKPLYIHGTDQRAKKASAIYATDGVNNAYSELFSHTSYIKMNVPIQANMTFDFLISKLYQSGIPGDMKEFNLVSIGSGPGADMVGVFKFFKYAESGNPGFPGIKIQAFYYDVEESWESTLRFFEKAVLAPNGASETAVVKTGTPVLTNLKVELEPGIFTKFDIASDQFSSDSPGCETGDLFTFVYLFSELKKYPEQQRSAFTENVHRLMRVAKIGAKFLFIDQRNSEGSRELGWIKTIADTSNCNWSLIAEEIGNDIYKMDSFCEDKMYLGEYFTQTQQPRLSAYRFCIAYEKRDNKQP